MQVLTEAACPQHTGAVTEALWLHTEVCTWVEASLHVSASVETHGYHSQWLDSGLTLAPGPCVTRLILAGSPSHLTGPS